MARTELGRESSWSEGGPGWAIQRLVGVIQSGMSSYCRRSAGKDKTVYKITLLNAERIRI